MTITETSLAGCLLLEQQHFHDSRGFFTELYVQQRFQQAGITLPLVQDNLSQSKRGVIRGMHFQRNKPQGKLISVLKGEIYDVMADIRPNSNTFGQWQGIYLSADQPRQLWLPPGFAHGFQALADDTLVFYKTSSYYDANDEGAFNVFDTDLAITWPLQAAILSAKDQQAPSFASICRILAEH